MIFPLILITGIITGFLSGFFGIGGGLILTPVIRIFLERPDEIALGTTLPVILPTAFFGLLARRNTRITNREIILYSCAGILIGSIIGSSLTGFINAKWLMVVTSLIIFLIGIRLFSAKRFSFLSKLSNHIKDRLEPSQTSALIGFSAGMLSGLLGIGGGLVLVPGFLLISGLEAHEATTISLILIFISAVPATAIHSYLGHIDWKLALCFGVLTPIGSYLGSYFASRIEGKRIERSFGFFLIVIGTYFLLFETLK
ncbi:MAG: sulfite exporter TauE/SafE family protein [Actinobacteria bacterium]|nr:sulfite exporter TauE/SafE family protein [Actinomycetota bacterium]